MSGVEASQNFPTFLQLRIQQLTMFTSLLNTELQLYACMSTPFPPPSSETKRQRQKGSLYPKLTTKIKLKKTNTDTFFGQWNINKNLLGEFLWNPCNKDRCKRRISYKPPCRPFSIFWALIWCLELQQPPYRCEETHRRTKKSTK